VINVKDETSKAKCYIICCVQDHVQGLTSDDTDGAVPLPNRRTAAGITFANGDAYLGTLSSQVVSEEYTAVESYPVNCVAMYDYQVCCP